jgi:hypothetical protein
MKNAVFLDVMPCGSYTFHPDGGGDVLLQNVGSYKSPMASHTSR